MKKFLLAAAVAIFLVAGLPKPSMAIIDTVKVRNDTTNCAWITPYRGGGIFGPPQWLVPGQQITFKVDNGIRTGHTGEAAGSGIPHVEYASVRVRAEFKGPGTTCNHATTKDLYADDTSLSVFNHVHTFAHLRGSPAHYHIEIIRV